MAGLNLFVNSIEREIPKKKSCLLQCNKSCLTFFLDALLFIISIVTVAISIHLWNNKVAYHKPAERENKTELYTKFAFTLQPQTSKPVPKSEVDMFVSKIPRVSEVDCKAFLVPPEEWSKSLDTLERRIPAAEKGPYVYDDCDKIKSNFFGIPVSEFEKRNSIAFSIMIYHSINRFFRLLRAIYRPSNVYCIHIDKKATNKFKEAILHISSCFDNTFVTNVSIHVEWGTSSVLEQEMICMKQLWAHKVQWKWIINLTGEEFPLKTNLELVHILSIMRGFSDVWVDPCTYGGSQYDTEYCRESTYDGFKLRWRNAPEPPEFVHPYKGQVHFCFSRKTADYILHNKISQALYNWSITTEFSDEIYFSTMNANIHIDNPGSNAEFPIRDITSIARLKLWRFYRKTEWDHCRYYMRSICLLTPRELPLLISSQKLFANKFKPTYRPLGYACLEEWYFTKVAKELITGRSQLDLRPYHILYYQYLGL